MKPMMVCGCDLCVFPLSFCTTANRFLVLLYDHTLCRYSKIACCVLKRTPMQLERSSDAVASLMTIICELAGTTVHEHSHILDSLPSSVVADRHAMPSYKPIRFRRRSSVSTCC